MLVHWYIGSGGLIWSFNCKPFHGRLRHTAAQEKMVHWYIGPAAMYQVKQAQCTNCQKPFEWISSRTDNAGGRQGLEVGTLVHWASSGAKVGILVHWSCTNFRPCTNPIWYMFMYGYRINIPVSTPPLRKLAVAGMPVTGLPHPP